MVRNILIFVGLFLSINAFGQYPRILLKQLEKASEQGQLILADSDSNAVWTSNLKVTVDSFLVLYGDTIQSGVNYEKIQDTIAFMLEAGLGIQMTYNDADGEFLIESLALEDSIYNGTASPITKGTPLYAVGVQGNYWSVAPADASDLSKLPAVVIAGEDISAGATGLGLLKGHIKQVSTVGFADGDEVYVGVGGGYTNVKPKGESNYVQRLGTVIKGNDANGSGIINLGEVQSVSNLNPGNIFIGDTDSTITTRVYIVDSTRVNATNDSIVYYQNGVQIGADVFSATGVWTEDASYVYYNGGKNVGIGTNAPFRELHVKNTENNKTVILLENTENSPFSTAEFNLLLGSQTFNFVNYSDSAAATIDGLAVKNKGVITTSNGMDGIIYAPINGQNYFLYNSRFDHDLLYIDATNDKIGIKDTTPTATFDVTGWVNITDSLVVNNIRVTGSGAGTINGVTTDATLTGDGTSGTPLSVVDDGHNHVISNVDGLQTALDSKLESEVDGSVSNELQTISTSGAAGNITLSDGGGTLNLNVDDADASATNEGSLTVGAGTASTSVISSNTSGSTDVTLTAGSNITLSETGNNITIASTGGGSIPVDTFVTIAGTETITGAKTFTSDIVVQNEETNTNAAELDLYKKNGSNAGEVQNGDNVGKINFKAESGATNSTGASIESVVTTLFGNEIGSDLIFKTASPLNSRPLTEAMRIDKLGNISLDSTLYVDATQNRVGIGTTSPSDKLTVRGRINLIDAGNSIYIGDSVGVADDLTDNRNVGIGTKVLYNNVSSYWNVGIGDLALYSNTSGLTNTAIGKSALEYNTSGSNNFGLGTYALRLNTSGNNNVGIGYSALISNTTGSRNIGIGFRSIIFNSTGSDNIGIGYEAGRYYGSGSTNLTNADSSVFIGSNSRASANNSSNEIVIGINTIGNGNNSVTIGNDGTIGTATTKVVINGVGTTGGTNSAVYITSGGELTTNSSDIRLKTNINTLNSELNTLMNLNPVKYNYYDDLENEAIGFVAQELEIYYPNLVFTNPISNYKGVHYHLFAPILTKAIQEQQAIIETQEQKITDLENTIQSLITRIENLENK